MITISSEAPADDETSGPGRLRLDSYEATARRIRKADRRLLHELTLSVLWPHRDRDLDLLMSLGEGYLALDEIGRAMGSAMYFPVGDDFAMLGMMVTPPRLQAQGAGRWLLQRIMQDCAGRDLRLSATRSGYWLYENAGFVPVGPIWQHQGRARPITAPTPAPDVTIRPGEPADAAAIAALDAHAYGAARAQMLDALIRVSDAVVAVRDGEICGYALMRRFGRGYVIGPLVAENDAIARQLVAPLILRCQGKFLRLDTPHEEFGGFLASAGLARFDSVTEMRIGPQRRGTEGPVLFGLAAHSLG